LVRRDKKIVRWPVFFDRGIARLVDFEAARSDCHTQNEMPRPLRERAN
jgi:hypothetical protein